jgi:predicted nucleotidyltransferase
MGPPPSWNAAIGGGGVPLASDACWTRSGHWLRLEPLRKRISTALIYGSLAKGADTAASDIDVLVVGDDLMLEDLYKVLNRVEHALGRKVNPTLLTNNEFMKRRATQGSFVNKVLAGPTIPILGTSGDSTAR